MKLGIHYHQSHSSDNQRCDEKPEYGNVHAPCRAAGSTRVLVSIWLQKLLEYSLISISCGHFRNSFAKHVSEL